MVEILAGTNTFLIKAEQKKRVEAFIVEHGDLALEKLDGEEADLNRVREAITSLPFLATKKMVVLAHAAANKNVAENIQTLLNDVSESTDLLIVEGRLDKRSVYYKTLKKQKGFKEFEELDEAALSKWLVSEAASRGGELSFTDAKYLVDRAGTNQQMLSGELEKLVLYKAHITRETIDLLVEAHPQSTVFELLDAAFAGNVNRALGIYEEQRALKVEPQAMLAMIAWQLHILSLIKVAGPRHPADIAREARVSPFVVNKSMTAAKNMSTAQLKKLVHDALVLDSRLKSEPIDADSALQNLIIQIAS